MGGTVSGRQVGPYAGDVLRAGDLLAAFAFAQEPKWARMIREAPDVEIRASEYLPEGDVAFVFDPHSPLWGNLLDDSPRPVVVVCRPEHEATVQATVAAIRNPEAP